MSPSALPRIPGLASGSPAAPEFGHQGARSGLPVPPAAAGGPTRELPFHSLAAELRRRLGLQLRRLMLDLGGTCPNRDGTSGYGGCIYCDVHGSGTGAARGGQDLDAQFEAQLRRVRRSIPDGPCGILYFQSYSNTWPALEPLERALEWAGQHAEVAPILAIGTRPDCFSEEAADLIARHAPRWREVWLEFGLETADDAVQRLIGRHDTLANFHVACARAGARGLKRVVHTMAGLPGAAPDDLLRQVREIARAGCEGLKFHQLMVLKRTQLARLWERGQVQLLPTEDYARRVAEALLETPWSVVIHRLHADAPAAERLDPGAAAELGLRARITAELLAAGGAGAANGPAASEAGGEASRGRTCD